MGTEVINLVNPYTYNFIKGLTHSAMLLCLLKIHLVGATRKFVIFPRIVCDSFGLGEDK